MCRRVSASGGSGLRQDVGLPVGVGRLVFSGLGMRVSPSLSGMGSPRPPQLGGCRLSYRVRLRPLRSYELPRV